MMLVTKASDDRWFDFETETNIIEVYKKYGSVIIEKNFWFEFRPFELIPSWNNISLDEAEKITKCEYNILIYDDYIE